jgi:hypothetical protein
VSGARVEQAALIKHIEGAHEPAPAGAAASLAEDP